MARANTSIARSIRYVNGLKVKSAHTKSGFRIDKSKPRDENDRVFCHKGDTYYWWKFRHGSKMFSMSAPRPSQLTQNEFYGALYSINEEMEDMTVDSFTTEGLLTEFRENIETQIEEIEQELEEKESNLSQYEGLANSPVYELITERQEAVSSWLNDMQAVDTDINFDELKDEAIDEIGEFDAEEMDQEDYDAEVDGLYNEKLRETIQEKIEEMQQCECEV